MANDLSGGELGFVRRDGIGFVQVDHAMVDFVTRNGERDKVCSYPLVCVSVLARDAFKRWVDGGKRVGGGDLYLAT